MKKNTNNFKSIFIRVILFIFLFKSDSYCIAQKNNHINEKSFTKCEAINFFLNSDILKENFKKLNLGDTSVVFVDSDHDIGSCDVKIWKNLPVTIINKGSMVDSLSRFKPYFVLKDRPNVYIFSITKQQGVILNFFFFNGKSNRYGLMPVREKRNRYFLGKIETGVY